MEDCVSALQPRCGILDERGIDCGSHQKRNARCKRSVEVTFDKEFTIWEQMKIQFRAEAFNSLNHPQFGLPGTVIGSSTAGVISQQVNLPRDIQFALKLIF